MSAGASGESPDAELRRVLAEARSAGFLGPGPIEAHVAHAEGFATTAQRLAPSGVSEPRLVDLGSGGGVPGLVVAVRWPEARLTLLEANGRRAAFLRRAVERLGLGASVSVLQERAERAGHETGLRGAFAGVLARSFGRPAVVAECAAPLLGSRGFMVVSEPPGDGGEGRGPEERWPARELEALGLEPLGVVRAGSDYMTLRLVQPCPDRFPRRNGVPAKRPLF